jgi:hypothetical protein
LVISANIKYSWRHVRIWSSEKSFIYILRPVYLEPEKVYQNPLVSNHRKKPDRVTVSLEHPTDPTNKRGHINDNLKNEVAVVFSSLIRSHCLIELDADKRIKTQLLAQVYTFNAIIPTYEEV